MTEPFLVVWLEDKHDASPLSNRKTPKIEYVFLLLLTMFHFNLSLVVRKRVFRVFDLIPHKPGCTATEDGLRLEIPN